MHIDVYPVVTNQFDSCRRYYSTKPSLTIIEPIQRIAHRLPQLQIPRPRTEPLPTLDLSNNYFPRHSSCFANYLNPISSEMQYMNHDPTIKDPVPERKVVCVGLDQVSDSLLSSLAIIESDTSIPATSKPESFRYSANLPVPTPTSRIVLQPANSSFIAFKRLFITSGGTPDHLVES